MDLKHGKALALEVFFDNIGAKLLGNAANYDAESLLIFESVGVITYAPLGEKPRNCPMGIRGL